MGNEWAGYIVAIIVGAISSGGVIVQLISNRKKRNKSEDNLTSLIVLTAGDTLDRRMKECISQGWAGVSEKHFLAEGCETYTAEGGNHIIGDKLKQVLALPECPSIFN